MLFIEAERMASCLYHPDDCESERTVIISELQGGENDPDQLLDQELTATAFKAHPYRHPTIGWLVGSADDDARRSVRLLPPLLRPEQRHAGDRRRRRHRRGAAARRASFRRHRRRAAPSSASAPSSPSRPASAALTIRKEGTTAYLKVGYHAPAVDRPRLLPAARARRRADRRQGAEPVVQLPRAAAAAQRASVSRARRARARVLRVRRARCRPSIRFSTRVSATATDGTPLAAVEAAMLEELDRVARDGITDAELAKAKAQLRARLVFDSDSVTNIAHQLGYFETIAQRRRVHERTGARSPRSPSTRSPPRRRRDARRRPTAPSAGSIRCSRRHDGLTVASSSDAISTTLRPGLAPARAGSTTASSARQSRRRRRRPWRSTWRFVRGLDVRSRRRARARRGCCRA